MQTALLVGINKYKTPGNDLQGCVNDVWNVKDVLTSYFGYSVLGIKTLFDNQATKAAIINNLKIMVGNSAKGDHLVYQHSSHGSQIEDVHGDEFDKLDEILCTYDFDWDGTYIVDDELREIFSKLKKGVTLDVILDSCHSGTGIRSLELNTRFIEPLYYPKGKFIVKRMLRGDLPTGVTLWAGCKSNQTSADARIDGKFNGAMTYFLCQEIRRAKGLIKRSKLYSNLKKVIKVDYEQIPQLETTLTQRYKRVFT